MQARGNRASRVAAARARGVAGAGGGSAGCGVVKFELKIEGRAAVGPTQGTRPRGVKAGERDGVAGFGERWRIERGSERG